MSRPKLDQRETPGESPVITLRMPQRLIDALDETAEKNFRSRSAEARFILTEHLMPRKNRP